MKQTRHDLMTSARMRAKRAIAAGDKEAALRAVDEIWEEGRPIHDLYGDMVAVFLDYIKEKLGEDAVEESWRYVGDKIWRPVLETYRDKDPVLMAETYAMFLRSHGYDFTCEEDDEKRLPSSCITARAVGACYKKAKPIRRSDIRSTLEQAGRPIRGVSIKKACSTTVRTRSYGSRPNPANGGRRSCRQSTVSSTKKAKESGDRVRRQFANVRGPLRQRTALRGGYRQRTGFVVTAQK